MYELPPRINCGAEEYLRKLREYLIRLTGELGEVEKAAAESIEHVRTGAADAARSAESSSAREILHSAATLKALIIRTADEIEQYEDRRFETLESKYVARSDWGSYTQSVTAQIEQTARSTVESYAYDEAIAAAADSARQAEEYITELSGQICRGLIEDPETGETHLGIAISEKLRFTGATQTVNGLKYFTLSPGQTLGLYTASGWQFWINGTKRGYFSSEDSMLHVSNIVVESALRISSGWEITPTGGLGIRCV